MGVIELFYRTMLSIVTFILKIFFRIRVYGIENEPSNDKLIICSNHANNLDPIFVSIAIKRQIRWMGKKELFQNKLVSWFITKLGVFPINRGETDITAIKTALRILKNDEVLGLFPEGTRVKNIDLENAKPGVALLAVKSKANILPVYIDSSYKLFSKVNIYIGKSLDMSIYHDKKLSSKEYEEVSKFILTNIYKLKNMEELN